MKTLAVRGHGEELSDPICAAYACSHVLNTCLYQGIRADLADLEEASMP
jgi:hypothetical protein